MEQNDKPKFTISSDNTQFDRPFQSSGRSKPLNFNVSRMGLLGISTDMSQMELDGNDNTEEMVIKLWRYVKMLVGEVERMQEKLEKSNVKWK